MRFQVFNIELGEGLQHSYKTGRDADLFDLWCDHLLVEDKLSRRVIGTYRLQSGEAAARCLGYFTEQEFCLAPYAPLRPFVLELGRASIAREHRKPEVLTLLWQGIAQYASQLGLRYLIGCSSIHSCDGREGWEIYRQLQPFRSAPEFEAEPTKACLCPHSQLVGRPAPQPKIPKLLRAYLAIGARVCSPPAWDRAFGTIDFLTMLDLESLSQPARHRFFGARVP